MATNCNNPTCGKKVKTGDKGLQCEICEGWFHSKCADVDDKDYAFLSKNISGMHWFCDYCNMGCVKIMKLIGKMQEELGLCKKELMQMKQQAVQNKFNIDKMEQYTRKDNALISNIPDPHEKVEDTNSIVIKLASEIGVTINQEDISTSHRLGSVTSHHVRPIIVRFTRRDTKRKLMMNRKQLKDNNRYPNVYLNDDLTKCRYKISKELRDQQYKVWSHDGKLLFKKGEGDISMMDTYADFCKLQWTEEKLAELGILQ